MQVGFFFFFKQKTAYEISACLVGSEMCIRDSLRRARSILTNATNGIQPIEGFAHYIGRHRTPRMRPTPSGMPVECFWLVAKYVANFIFRSLDRHCKWV